MKAMILAAGLGTRLRPLTEDIPKALVPVVNIPVLIRNILYLNSYGITEIIINCHYLGHMISEFIEGSMSQDIKPRIRVEPEILGTGGGISNCRDFLGEGPFLVINSDIITNIRLNEVIEKHVKTGDMVTLVLHEREPFNQIHLNSFGNIKEIHGENHDSMLAFTGIHLLNPEIFRYIPEKGYSDIIHVYRSLLQCGKNIGSFKAEGHIWYDIGTIESYKNANRDFLRMNRMTVSTGTDTLVDDSARISDWAVIGDNTVIERNSVIEGSVILNGVRIKENVCVRNSVVRSGRTVDCDLMDEVY